MPAVFLTTPGTRASLVSERLHIEIPPSNGNQDQVMRDIPLVDVEHVVANETTHITMAAIAELLRRNIPLVVNSSNDAILGLCLRPAPHATARLEQYRKSLNPEFALALAINWVEAKILNSRRVLQRLAANRDELEITPHLLTLGQLAQSCQQALSIETLRGYEGTAAGRYFECYAEFFPDRIPFERRSRRPPHNAPNAILSYAYTLMVAEPEAYLYAIGLDPAIGFYHEPADRRLR
jgi:CRISP-associated protein Cas1